MTIVEFLTARLAEDDADGRTERAWAEVAAKRAIVDDYVTTCRIRDEASAQLQVAWASKRIEAVPLDTWHRASREASIMEGALLHLAAAYSDHPDYEQAWAVT